MTARVINTPSRPSPGLRSGLGRGGFTLVEILVVMTIMVIMIAAGASKLRSPEPRPADTMQSVINLINLGRAKALATGVTTRIAVCTDPNAGDKYLRHAFLLLDVDGDPTTSGWRMLDEGLTFAQGTIYWPDYSSIPDPLRIMRIDLSNLAAVHDGVTGEEFTFLEFSPIGEPVQAGVQWAFAATPSDVTVNPPSVPNPLNLDAFLLRQTGRVSVFHSPSAIPATPAVP